VNEPNESWVFKPGDVFNRVLHVKQRLGAGLHGEVYLVEHALTHDRLALKIMHLADVRDASRVRRALSTAKATYWVKHANVVKVTDIGCEDDGKVWILMEYLEGTSVAEQLDRQGGRMSAWLALHIAIEAAWGLDAAHEAGIIHRDIKPENLWLTLRGLVKVIDFSLAKVVPEGVQTTLRKTGMGTPPYMAPEQLSGGLVDARSDIYALGMVLWQMLGGRHPFPDALYDTKEMVRRQLYVDPEPLSVVAHLPAYVDEFMARALAKDPAQRFLSMSQMARGMMTMRDQLLADCERGILLLEYPAGEPRYEGDPMWRQAYVPARPMTPAATEPPQPSRRVVIVEQGPAAPAVGLGGTLPLTPQPPTTTQRNWPPRVPVPPASAPTAVSPVAAPAVAPPRGSAPTAPAAAGPVVVVPAADAASKAGTAPGSRAERDTARGGTAEGALGPDTVKAITRPTPPRDSAAGATKSRAPMLVFVGIVAAVLASAGVLAWARTRPGTTRVPVPASASSVSTSPPAATTTTGSAAPPPASSATATSSSPTVPAAPPSAATPSAATPSSAPPIKSTAPALPTAARPGPRHPPAPPPSPTPPPAPTAKHRIFGTEP
jgi:serine/threonine-protein kinase